MNQLNLTLTNFLPLYHKVLRALNHPIRSLNYDYDTNKPLHFPSVLEFLNVLDAHKEDILQLVEYKKAVEQINAELNR